MINNGKDPNRLNKYMIGKNKTLTQITPIDPILLIHRINIIKSNKELIPLNKMKQNAKGRLLSIKETTFLSLKTDLFAKVHDLEQYIH